MVDILRKFAEDEGKTKAVFDHARNLLTASAFLAAGQWLLKRPLNADYLKHPVMNSAIGVAGGLIVLAGLALLLVAVFNAQAKMFKLGFKSMTLVMLSIAQVFVVVYGIFAYSMLH